MFSDISFFDLSTWKWTPIDTIGDLPVGRSEHASFIYKHNQLVVFGGMVACSGMNGGTRMLSNDLVMFNPEKSSWERLRPKGLAPKPRAGHTVNLIGDSAYLLGGNIGLSEYVLDLNCLNIMDGFKEGCHWNRCGLQNNTNLGGFAHHQTANVFFRKKNKNGGSYGGNPNERDLDEIGNGTLLTKPKEEGIYIFGGLTRDDYMPNEIFILKFGNELYVKGRTIKLEKLKTNGIRPSQRAHHTMAYLDKSNYLLIYGGRNDAVNELYLNDLHILDTASLNWCAVSISKPMIPRCGHSMVITDNCLLIFGGINSDGYISPEIALYRFRTLVSSIVKKVLNQVGG